MTNDPALRPNVARRRGTARLLALFGGAFGGVLFAVGILIVLAERHLPVTAVWDGSVFSDDRLLWIIGSSPFIHAVSFWLVGRARERLAIELRQRRVGEAEMRFLALRDDLTGLPNRAGLLARLDRGGVGALLILDFDRFRIVNDTLGHAVGDDLLRVAADRLVGETSRHGWEVHRLGGDEFAVVVPGASSVAAISAAGITALFADPFVVGETAIEIAVSVGICAIGEPVGPRELVRRTEIALYAAKRRPGISLEVFDEAMDAAMRGRSELERDLARGLAAGEFVLHYQPIHDAATGRPTACEALVRWASPTRGLVGPADFIDVTEETGLIVELGRWVLSEACREAAGWPSSIGVAVNVSPVQFRDRDFLADLGRTLDVSGLEPARLTLEITESLFVEDRDDIVRLLARIRTLGVRISLDDFGTGYSNLAYLHRIPLDRVKVDATFVRRMTTDPIGARIVETMVRLAHDLGKEVTIEGIELAAQLDFVRRLGADEVQGFLLGRPVPADELVFADAEEGVRSRSPGADAVPQDRPSPSDAEGADRVLDHRQIRPDFPGLPLPVDAG